MITVARQLFYRLLPLAGQSTGPMPRATIASEATGGALQSLQGFMTNPAGAAVVNAIGPIRQLVRGEDKSPRRYLVIAPGTGEHHGAPVQVQAE